MGEDYETLEAVKEHIGVGRDGQWSPEDIDVTAGSLLEYVRHVLFHQDEDGFYWFQCFSGYVGRSWL